MKLESTKIQSFFAISDGISLMNMICGFISILFAINHNFESSAILMIISAIGFLTLDKNMNNLIYARIHIVGVFDVAFIIAMIGLQQYLLAGIYLVIAPFIAHAIANAFYNSEDKVNNLKNKEVEVESSDDENPFVHNINKVKEMENKSYESNDDSIKFSISTLEISEDE